MGKQRKLQDQAVIQAEIAALKAIKPKVRKASTFGDNHHAAIDAQLEVLERSYTEDRVYQEFPAAEEGEEDGTPQNVLDAALEAAQWMFGDWDAKRHDGATCPSETWKELVVK